MSTTVAGRVMPIIAVGSVDQTRDFYVDTLGFTHMMGVVGKDGQLDFCSVLLGEAQVMFKRGPSAAAPAGSSQAVEVYLEVEDVDAFHARLPEEGRPRRRSADAAVVGRSHVQGARPERLRAVVLHQRGRAETAAGHEGGLTHTASAHREDHGLRRAAGRPRPGDPAGSPGHHRAPHDGRARVPLPWPDVRRRPRTRSRRAGRT